MPVPYFISFRTYGTWLHGEREGSVDRDHNTPGGEFAQVKQARAAWERTRMTGPPITLDPPARTVVLSAIGGVCFHRGWSLWAIHIRTNHLHVVVSVGPRADTPERVMNDFKAWATRRLVEAGIVAHGARVWAHHGSTRYLDTENSFARACHYTYHEQEGVRFDPDRWKGAWSTTTNEPQA